MPTIPLCHVLCVLHTNYFRSFVWNFSHRLQRTTKVCRWNINLEKRKESTHFFSMGPAEKKGKSNQQKEQKLFFFSFLLLRFPSINFSSLNSFQIPYCNTSRKCVFVAHIEKTCEQCWWKSLKTFHREVTETKWNYLFIVIYSPAEKIA